jgi:hypothetical protein
MCLLDLDDVSMTEVGTLRPKSEIVNGRFYRLGFTKVGTG